jgi:hypothetical protein
MIVAGPIVALKGRQLFPWVVSSVVSFVTFFIALMLCSVMGWMDSTLGFWICIGIAIAAGGVAGAVTYRLVWVAIGMLGIIAGLALGAILFTITAAAFEVGSPWLMAIFAISFACLGGWCAWKYARDVVLIGTSLIGSYSFMRGCTTFFGGYPNEAELISDFQNQLPVDDMENIFWIYLCMFILGTLFGIFYQIRHGRDHSALENEASYNKSSDNFHRYKNKN